jgi:hypothetical protein
MTIEELFNTDSCFYVHTGKKHLKDLVQICEDHDTWWCGQRNEKTPEISIDKYAEEIGNAVGLKIILDRSYRSFTFMNTCAPVVIEYEDLIESKKIDFSDFDSIF